MRHPELSERLLRQLQARPWLLVLDGLERVLVAYHRYDAAQLADEEAGRTDQIARRDPAPPSARRTTNCSAPWPARPRPRS